MLCWSAEMILYVYTVVTQLLHKGSWILQEDFISNEIILQDSLYR